jgi:type I restriction enzyme S subunit
MSWEELELKEISKYRTEKISTTEIETNYISTENMLPEKGGIIDSSYPPTSKTVASFKTNDILVSNIRPYFKKIWFADFDGGCSNDVIVFKSDENNLIPKFLYYQLSKDEFFDFMMSGANGTKMPRGNRKAIPTFKLLLPPLQTQKRIADILSAYDDLIENNLKRIKLLEQAAQNIYKEWFVNMHFPGYENISINEETGLPEGWKEVLMEDIMNVSGGGTPSTKESLYWEKGKVLWFSPTDLNKNNSLVLIDSTKKITELGLKKSSAKLLPQRTILMSSRATIGLFGLFNGDCSTNQGFININPKEESLRYYILFNLKSRVEELIANASGATFKELSKRVFKRMSIVSPNASISTNFYNQVELFINQTENLEFQNQKLKAARDILLPRLMNRTIKV